MCSISLFELFFLFRIISIWQNLGTRSKDWHNVGAPNNWQNLGPPPNKLGCPLKSFYPAVMFSERSLRVVLCWSSWNQSNYTSVDAFISMVSIENDQERWKITLVWSFRLRCLYFIKSIVVLMQSFIKMYVGKRCYWLIHRVSKCNNNA